MGIFFHVDYLASSFGQVSVETEIDLSYLHGKLDQMMKLVNFGLGLRLDQCRGHHLLVEGKHQAYNVVIIHPDTKEPIFH